MKPVKKMKHRHIYDHLRDMTQCMEWQVSCLELSKLLKELGVRQESAFYWRWSEGKIELSRNSEATFALICSAFTVAELGEMLPDNYTTFRQEKIWFGLNMWIELDKHDLPGCYIETETGLPLGSITEANARAKMLIYLIKEGVVKP